MTLQKKDKNALVSFRLQRANETLAEVKGTIKLGYWRVAANRLYYACYYATSALLINNNLTAHTHSGVINQFGLHFVLNGILSKEHGKLLKRLFELRQNSDYNDWFYIEEEDVKPYIEPAERFIAEIENLINNDKEQ